MNRGVQTSPAGATGAVSPNGTLPWLPWRKTWGLVRRFARLIGVPLRLYRALRNSMTPASVTLLLVGIVTWNIIWGYPWSGLFAACASSILIGFGINRLMRPKLSLNFSVPRSSPAGKPFRVTCFATNISRLPALDVGMELEVQKGKSRKWRRRRRQRMRLSREAHSVPLIQSGEQVRCTTSMQFDQRGIHAVPDLIVGSWFPFHLFCSYQRYPSGVRLAITPRLLTHQDDAAARGLLETLGGWSHRLLAGDALDYTGSREYEVGMPVRRWDFPSWARLGRPIVREFQSPTMQQVTLLVDTASDLSNPTTESVLLERVLSYVATAITELSRKSIRLQVFVTGQIAGSMASDPQHFGSGDPESLLLELARAKAVSIGEANQQLELALEAVGQRPILLFTSRKELPIDLDASSLWSRLQVELPPDGSTGTTDHEPELPGDPDAPRAFNAGEMRERGLAQEAHR